MLYTVLKTIHVSSALLTIAGFTARGALMLRGSNLLRARFVRIAPHVVDTILLCSAVWLALVTGQYPFVQSWLTAKTIALIAYILLGAVAISYGRTRSQRTVAFVLALSIAIYIVSVAILRTPMGFLARWR